MMSTDATYRRIQVQNSRNSVTVVTFVDRKILDVAKIQKLHEKLLALVEQDGNIRLVFDFREVEFLSDALINRLIYLDKLIRGKGGGLKLCNMLPQVREIFIITRLHKSFDIKDTVDDALAAFER